VPGTAQSIGAFASLHVSILVTVALATHLLATARVWKVTAWGLAVLTTVATVYFGWHYLVDDIGGVVIAATALGLTRALTGFDLRAARRLRRLGARGPYECG